MPQVLAEHLEYLLLPGRSQLFRDAIAVALKPDDLVADLGCGLGVLGLFCLEAGASRVWGIDQSDAIHLARETVRRAGYGERYECIAGSTFFTELPERVDLILCDHVGFFGFDYGIIGLMRDARRRFLKPDGRMIPQSLDLFVAGVSSDDCAAKAGAWSQDEIPPFCRWMDELGRNERYAQEFGPDDLISAPVALGHVSLAEDEQDFFRFEAQITAQKAGRFDGIAGWFDCHLAGSVRMTNSPLASESIRRAQAFLPAGESFPVEAGDVVGVTLRFRADDNLIAWTLVPPGGAPRQQMSTLRSMILNPADLLHESGLPVRLGRTGEARAFVLSLIDGVRTGEQIVAKVLAERPDLLPSEAAIRDFVKSVLAQDGIAGGRP